MTEPTPQETAVEYVDLLLPAAEHHGAAVALLAAAGDDAACVRTIGGGFRVPVVIARAAGLLDEVAGPAEPTQPEPAKPGRRKAAAPAETPAE